MRMLHVIDCLARGGAETLLLNTIDRLPGHEHIVVTISDKFEFDEYVKSKFIYHTLHCGTKSQWPLAVMKIRKLIRKYQPSLVHCHLHAAGVLTKLACPPELPLFYSIHTIYSSSAFKYNRWARPLEKITARPRHHLVGVSQQALDDYTQLIPGSGTKDVLYNFVNERFFDVRPANSYIPGQPLRCVSIGNLKYQKNYYYTLRNFALTKDLPVYLDIYGKGPEEQKMKAVMQELSLEKVTLKDVMDDISQVLPFYDLFIINSNLEGFGIAPLEAMAAKVPVVVSNIPTFKEVIGDAGIPVKLEQDDDLATVLRKIYEGKISLPEFAKKGHERALMVSHPDKYIANLKSIYEKYL